MRRRGSAVAAWLALAAGSLAAMAWAQPAAPAFPLEDLRPGLVGYGLTEGPAGVERFDVEVIAVQEGLGLGFPLVLVRASGAVIDLGGGVAAGMSGSPVMLPRSGGEALLGAIGYVFPDAPGGLALVTPIEAMRAQASERAVRPAAPAPDGAWGVAAARLGAAPVATPVLVTGLGERALRALADAWTTNSGRPVQLVPGGGGGATARGPLQPGSAVAVAWVRGDVDIGAVGTVTEVDGDRVLAFGHPVLGSGPVAWPLLAATVTAIVPQRHVPFKLANTGDTILGRVDQDRPAAIGARLGAAPDMLPVTLTVATSAGTRSLRFEVVRDPALWPTLVAVATLELLDRVRERVGEGTATVHWDVAFRQGPGLRLSEAVVDAWDVASAAARLAGAPLALLAGNPFQDPEVTRVTLLVRLEDTRRDVEVRQAVGDGAPAVAGGVVPLFLRLQPWRRPGEVLAVDVRWPEDLVGRAEVVVRGATWPRAPDEREAPDPDDAPLTFDELLAFLRDRPGGGDLVIDARVDGGPWRRLDRVALGGFVTGRVELTFDVAPPADASTTPDGRSEEAP